MKTAAVILLAILTASRLWLAAAHAVTPLEAYYWMCTSRLDAAFFDGPGGTAWLVWVTSGILGDGPLGLRLAFPIFAAAASVAAWLLGRALFGELTGLWAAVALNTIPFFNIAAIHAGPNLPALTFTLLSALAFVRALDRGLPWWLLSGVWLALAAQFSYVPVLLVFAATLACAFSRRHRAEWRRPGLYVMAVVAFAGLIPSVAWNQSHDWPAFASGTLHTALTVNWAQIGPALGTDILLFPITVFASAAFAIIQLFRKAGIHARPRLTLWIAAPFMTLWLFDVLHGDPSPAVFLLTCATLSAGIAHVFLAGRPLRVVSAVMLGLTALVTAMPVSVDPWTASSHGIAWHDVAPSLDGLLVHAADPQKAPLMLIAENPDATAALNYHLRGREVFLRESQDASNQFALWPRYDDFVTVDKPPDELFTQEGNTTSPYVGRSALYVTDESFAELPQTIKAAFIRISPYATLELAGGRKLRVYLCDDYQTMPL